MAGSRVRVCFVCLGNISRSPTAEGVFRAQVAAAGLADAFEIDSAGTGAWHTGEPPDARSAQAAAERGYRLGGEARQFVELDFARFDHVLAMDGENLRNLRELAPDRDSAARVRLLRDSEPGAAGSDVPDPYYGGDDGFARVIEICERACEALLDELVRKHGLGER